MRQAVRKIAEWLDSEGLTASLSVEESRLLEMPAGSWQEQELINVSWRVVAVEALLWALAYSDAIPGYDAEPDEGALMSLLCVLSPIGPFLSESRLRPAVELDKARDLAELWHWRARTTELMRKMADAPAPKGLSLPDIIKAAAEKAHGDGYIPEPIDGDFPAFGKAYRDLDEYESAIAKSIAAERHFALNWVCGQSEDWDETPTNT